jgi:hypothetical protein
MAPSLKTTINKINRTLENNVRIANKVIEENVRNVTKAAKKVPWLHVVIGVIAVGIILYCIWKLLKPRKGRKEGFGERIDWGNDGVYKKYVNVDYKGDDANDKVAFFGKTIGGDASTGIAGWTVGDPQKAARECSRMGDQCAGFSFNKNMGGTVWFKKGTQDDGRVLQGEASPSADGSTDFYVKAATAGTVNFSKVPSSTTKSAGFAGKEEMGVLVQTQNALGFGNQTAAPADGTSPGVKPFNINDIQTAGAKFDNINFVGRNATASTVAEGTHLIGPVGNVNACLSAAQVKKTDMVYKKSTGECTGKYIRKDDIGKPDPEGIKAVGDNDYISISWNSSWNEYNGGKDAATLNAINKGPADGTGGPTNPSVKTCTNTTHYYEDINGWSFMLGQKTTQEGNRPGPPIWWVDRDWEFKAKEGHTLWSTDGGDKLINVSGAARAYVHSHSGGRNYIAMKNSGHKNETDMEFKFVKVDGGDPCELPEYYIMYTGLGGELAIAGDTWQKDGWKMASVGTLEKDNPKFKWIVQKQKRLQQGNSSASVEAGQGQSGGVLTPDTSVPKTGVFTDENKIFKLKNVGTGKYLHKGHEWKIEMKGKAFGTEDVKECKRDARNRKTCTTKGTRQYEATKWKVGSKRDTSWLGTVSEWFAQTAVQATLFICDSSEPNAVLKDVGGSFELENTSTPDNDNNITLVDDNSDGTFVIQSRTGNCLRDNGDGKPSGGTCNDAAAWWVME